MAGKNSAARQPVLSDMSDEDNAAFEAMRTGQATAPEPAPTAPQAAPVEEPQVAATPETPAPAHAEKPPAATTEPAPEGTEREPRMVPHAALHEEREMRKERDRELATEREQTRLLTQRLAQLAEAIGPKLEAPTPQPQPEQTPEIPDPEKDPVAYIKATYPLVKQMVEERAQNGQRQRQVSAQQQAVNTAVNGAMNAEAEFRGTTPDYDQAAEHLRAARGLELEALGVAPAQRAQMIQNETVQLAVMAQQSRRNFAQLVYGLAKARGYQPNAAPAPTPAAPPAAAAVAPPATPPAAPAAPVPTEEQRLEMARRGQEQGRSLSQAGGAAPRPAMTAEKLANMSDAEFAATLAKLSAGQERDIFGR